MWFPTNCVTKIVYYTICNKVINQLWMIIYNLSQSLVCALGRSTIKIKTPWTFFFSQIFLAHECFFSHFNRVSVNNRSLRIEPPHRTASYRKKEKKKNQLKLLSAHLGLNNTFWGLLYLDRVLWSDKSWYEEEKSLSGHRARVWCFTGTPRTHREAEVACSNLNRKGESWGIGLKPGGGGLGSLVEERLLRCLFHGDTASLNKILISGQTRGKLVSVSSPFTAISVFVNHQLCWWEAGFYNYTLMNFAPDSAVCN